METTAKISVPLSLRLSGSALKIIAILSMVADHCAYFLMEPDTPMYDLSAMLRQDSVPCVRFPCCRGVSHIAATA